MYLFKVKKDLGKLLFNKFECTLNKYLTLFGQSEELVIHLLWLKAAVLESNTFQQNSPVVLEQSLSFCAYCAGIKADLIKQR